MRLRGRKGIRENLEQQTDLVILDPSQYKGRWHELFGNDRPIHVEFGMGKGKFISEMSVKHKDHNYIGVDRYDELLRRASEKARIGWWHELNHSTDNEPTEEQFASITPPNLKLALFDITNMHDVFEAGELERIYLNFSDPWPKKRHASRRLTHPDFVRKYRRILNDNGEIHLKTDSQTLFEFSLNSFADMGLHMRNISLNLHREGIHPDHVLTEYESKFTQQGVNIHRCEVLIGKNFYQEDKPGSADGSTDQGRT